MYPKPLFNAGDLELSNSFDPLVVEVEAIKTKTFSPDRKVMEDIQQEEDPNERFWAIEMVSNSERKEDKNLGNLLPEENTPSINGDMVENLKNNFSNSEQEIDEALLNYEERLEVEEEAEVDEAQDILMLPWYENQALNIKQKLMQLQASVWVKRNMTKISKQLGIKTEDIGEKLMELLMRIDSERPKKSSSSASVSTVSPSKKCERELKLLEFGVGFGGDTSKGGRGKGRRAFPVDL